jgi:hypothetical protein
MRIIFAWDVTQYSLVELYQCFEKKPEKQTLENEVIKMQTAVNLFRRESSSKVL